MMGMGSVDMRELVKLQENLKKLADEAKRQQFCEACAKELAARLIIQVFLILVKQELSIKEIKLQESKAVHCEEDGLLEVRT